MLLLVTLYVLSIGPEHGLMYWDLISHDVHKTLLDTIYYPLILLTEVSDRVGYLLKRYVVLFHP